MEHGLFEALQGSSAPDGMLIEAIGPGQRFWEFGTEIAMTVVPNLLVTGILAMTVGLAIVVWPSPFVQTRYGAHVLAVLNVMPLLFGGGFAPVFAAGLAILAASPIGRPSTWRGAHIPADAHRFLARSWKGSLIAVAALYALCIVSGVFGWPLLWFFDPQTTTAGLLVSGLAVLALRLYVVPAGFALDIHERAESPPTRAHHDRPPSI